MYTLQELKDAVVELYKNNTPIPKPNTSARILKVAVAKICGEKKRTVSTIQLEVHL